MMAEYAWLVPLFPLALVPLAWFLGKKFPREGAELGILGTAVSLIISALIGLEYLSSGETMELRLVNWVNIESEGKHYELFLSLRIDQLSILMMIIVSFIATLIMVYSLGYMHGEEGLPRYFGEMLLFVGSMLLIVMAGDLLTLFIGWEGVGVSSYLLIGFWYKRPPAASAAKKAFLTTKMGDVFMTAGIATIFWKFGTLHIATILEGLATLDPQTKFWVGLALFIGAIGKSAQFPLLAWLWDAMEGPTTVSAILHSSTMVKAGVFLMARMFPLVASSPKLMMVIAYIGGATAFIAATMALVEFDIKRVLAYSTISQIGYMMAAIGLGGVVAGMLHLVSHAFFKALLFLCAGSVVHAMHHVVHDPWDSRDMRYMGGLKSRMKITYYTMVIGGLALAGIFPLSGFWSKDMVIEVAAERGDLIVFWLLVITALLTAFYIFRLIFLTFHGEFRGKHNDPSELEKIHESPSVMTVPMMILAGVTVILGVIIPLYTHGFMEYIIGTYEGIHLEFEHGIAGEYIPYLVGHAVEPLWLVSLSFALGGIGASFAAYEKKIIDVEKIVSSSLIRPIYVFLQRKYFFDDIYLLFSEGLAYGVISRFLAWFDMTIVDGIVNGLGLFGRAMANFTQWFDMRIIDGIVNGIGRALKSFGSAIRRMQVGVIEDYMLLFAIGVIIVFLVGLFLMGVIPLACLGM